MIKNPNHFYLHHKNIISKDRYQPLNFKQSIKAPTSSIFSDNSFSLTNFHSSLSLQSSRFYHLGLSNLHNTISHQNKFKPLNPNQTLQLKRDQRWNSFITKNFYNTSSKQEQATISRPNFEINSNQYKGTLKWKKSPKTVLLVHKKHDGAVDAVVSNISRFLTTECKLHVVLEESSEILEHPNETLENLKPLVSEGCITFYDKNPEILPKVDFVIALGGDGTVLHVASLFEDSHVPPVLAFSLGTLGFMIPFDAISEYKQVINQVIYQESAVSLRSRLNCKLIRNGKFMKETRVLNEVGIQRGNSMRPVVLQCAIGDYHLSTFKGDGLLIGTATGSTGYSMSAGGSMVHPGVDCVLVTPVCPQTPSFRPMVLPADAHIHLTIPPTAPTMGVVASLDSRKAIPLERDDEMMVRKSSSPFPMIVRSPGTSPNEDHWLGNIHKLLKFNQPLSSYKR
eukprot:gb/GECH01007690.1/.p1 GENE.gb/GECH01007690.1/~~gb/GECH01007690.1/.p1  ORF type:complete len:453 (+),score=90.61 gb/GECH01007690.1/:1-1359(+)